MQTRAFRLDQLRTDSGVAFPAKPLFPAGHGFASLVIDPTNCAGLRFLIARGAWADISVAGGRADIVSVRAGEVVSIHPEDAIWVSATTAAFQRVGGGGSADGLLVRFKLYAPGECPDVARPQFLPGELVKEFDTSSASIAAGGSDTILSGIMDDLDLAIGLPLWCEVTMHRGACSVDTSADYPLELNLMMDGAESAGFTGDRCVGLFPGDAPAYTVRFRLPSYFAADPDSYAWALVVHNPTGSAAAKSYAARCRVFAGPMPGPDSPRAPSTLEVKAVSASATILTRFFWSTVLECNAQTIRGRILNGDSGPGQDLSVYFNHYVPTVNGGPSAPAGVTTCGPGAYTTLTHTATGALYLVRFRYASAAPDEANVDWSATITGEK